MKVIRELLAAFSLYSRIPMPPVRFEKGEGRRAILFLPLVGAVIGGVVYGALMLNRLLGLPIFVLMILLTVIPLVLTGGFHLDGFLDVEDALSSCQDKEKKLQILKDPHIGAFAVIRFSLFGLLWLGALYLLIYCAGQSGEEYGLYQYAVLFAASRLLRTILPASEKGEAGGNAGWRNEGGGKGESYLSCSGNGCLRSAFRHDKASFRSPGAGRYRCLYAVLPAALPKKLRRSDRGYGGILCGRV